jgi:tRNA1Val (adenine37-N6)-methyltransferase
VLLGAWAEVEKMRRILDIGTGTGVVALMLAQRSCSALGHPPWAMEPGADLTALDLHPPSVALAARNFAASPWAERLRAVEMSVQDFAQQAEARFDLIVSNPPFFSERTVSPDPERRLARHTASLPPEDLLGAVQRLLALGGRFCAVLPPAEGQRLCELAVPMGLCWTKIARVRPRPGRPVERWLIQFERDPYPFEQTELLLAEGSGERSEAFRALTDEFYL